MYSFGHPPAEKYLMKESDVSVCSRESFQICLKLHSIYLRTEISTRKIILGDVPQHVSCIGLKFCGDSIKQGFSKFTFKGPNLNYHQHQKLRNNCYYKTCFYKHAYNFI